MSNNITSSLRASLIAFVLAASQIICNAADLFVANSNNTIQEFTEAGVASTFASSGLNNPYGLAFDNSGNLFASNFSDGTIVKFTLAGSRSVFATLGASTFPTGLAFDLAGNLFVARFNGSILKFTPEGTQSVFITSGPFQVQDLAFDSLGNLYASSDRNSPATGTIERITPAGVVTTFASGLVSPHGMAFDTQNNLYVANSGVNTIVKITPAGSSSVFAGVSGTTNNGLVSPFGLAFDGFGNLYAANGGLGGNPGSIERFTPTATHSTFAATSSGSPKDIALAVPEPSSAPLLVVGTVLCLRRRTLRK